MTKFCLLYIRGIITTRAGYVCIPTNFGTGRCLRLVSYFVMPKRFLFHVGAIIATRTCHVRIPTDFSTSGCFRFVRHFIVTQRVLFYVGGVIATRTCHVSIPTDFGTGRCFRFVRHFSVTKFCLLYIRGIITTRAGYVCIPTNFGTGRCLRLVSYFVMPKRCIQLYIAHSTDLCRGTSCCRTGAMSLRINRFLRLGNRSANRAMLTLGQAGLGAGRCHSLVNDLGVTQSVNSFLRNQHLATCGAMLTLGQTGLGASRCLRHVNDLGVTRGGNLCLRNQNFIASSAMLAFGQTRVFAIRGNCRVNDFLVSKHRDHFLSSSGFTAHSTLCTVGQTCFGAGCCLTGYGFGSRVRTCSGSSTSVTRLIVCATLIISVTGCRNFCLCNRCYTTNGTLLTFGQTGFGTRCCLPGNRFFGVTECIYCSLRNSYSSAYGAMLAFSQARCGTSRCYSCIDHLGMTFGGNLFCIRITTITACKGLNTGFSTCRCSRFNGFITMPRRLNSVTRIRIPTNGTSVSRITGSRTSRSGYDRFIVMLSGSGNGLVIGMLLTNTTSICLCTIRTTGGIVRIGDFVTVSSCTVPPNIQTVIVDVAVLCSGKRFVLINCICSGVGFQALHGDEGDRSCLQDATVFSIIQSFVYLGRRTGTGTYINLTGTSQEIIAIIIILIISVGILCVLIGIYIDQILCNK